MLRFPVACLAAAATILLALAGDARAAVHMERVGDVIEIRGDAGNDSPYVSSFETAVELQDNGVTAGPGCSVRFNLGSCPVEGARLVRVTLGDGRDRIYVRGAGGPSFSVEGGADDDHIQLNAPGRDVVEGGPGVDQVDYSFAGGPATAFLGGGSGGDDLLTGLEWLTGSAHADVLSGGPDPDLIFGAAGDDRIDVRGGGADRVDCGTNELDVASVDASDSVSGCPAVSYDGGPPRPAPIVSSVDPRYSTYSLFQSRVRPVGLVASPTIVPGGLVLLVRTPLAGRVSVAMTVAPWSAPAATEQLAPASADAAEPGVVAVRLALPPGAAAALQRERRLRTRLTLRYADGRATPDDRTGVVTVVAPSEPRLRLDGRTLRGGFGVQVLRGSGRGDLLSGKSANDVLLGHGANDRLRGGTGDDLLDGGTGDDMIDGDDGSDRLVGGPGADLLAERRFGDDLVAGGDGDDRVFSGRGTDHVAGGPGDDVISGGSGMDIVDCGPGEDILFVNGESERHRSSDCEEIHLEPGVINRPCFLGGTDDSETVLGTDEDDVCRAGAGDDDVEGAAGNDVLDGGEGADRIFGRFGTDELLGRGGDDELEGGRDEDRLSGGDGDDRLNGGFAADVVSGGAGDDRIVARGGGTDTVRCGPGEDTVFADSADRVARDCERVVRSGPRRARRR